MKTRRFYFLFWLICLTPLAWAQPTPPNSDTPSNAVSGGSIDHFNQEALRAIQNNQVGSPDEIPQVFYDYYVVREDSRLKARLKLYETLGINGNEPKQNEGKVLLQLINRNLLEELRSGDTLVVPTKLGLDLRAYSPFPRFYQAGREIPKIVFLEKTIQAFAAYENGVLKRWGIINTGKDASQTPNGRFNVNYRAQTKISSLSPGVVDPKSSEEIWEMTWVMNLHETRGIHMHQYAMPTGGPASHGCVRMNDADAEYLFNWVDTWETTKGKEIDTCWGEKDCKVTKEGTMVIVMGNGPKNKPQPFILKPRYPILKVVDLPTDPFSIPAGTEQQRWFDKVRELVNKPNATLPPQIKNPKDNLSSSPKTTSDAKPAATTKPATVTRKPLQQSRKPAPKPKKRG